MRGSSVEVAGDLFVVLVKIAVEDSRNGCAEQRADDEYPYLRNCGEVSADHLQECGAQRAGGVDRSAREAYAEQMHKGERKADDYARYSLVVRLGSNAENGEHKGECEHDFNDEADKERARIAVSGCEDRLNGIAAEVFKRAEEQPDDCRADDCAQNLTDYVTYKFLCGHLFADEHGKANGGIDVAARNVAYGICHGDDYKAEGERRGDYAVVADAARSHRHAAAEHDEDHRADKFGHTFFSE